MADLTLRFAMDVQATDTDRRTITGRIVPYGIPGNTSIGPVTFTAGALDYDVDDVRLLLEHDQRRPIGRAVNLEHGDDGIVGTFRVSATTAGADALIEAADGLRDGLSVGVRVTGHDAADDGSLTVTAGQLEEVSLVVRPAFNDARVTEVAASQPAPQPEEPAMTEHTEDVTEVTATDPEPAVQAAEPPTTRLQVRDRAVQELPTHELARLNVLAQMGDRDAREMYLRATGTSDVAGLIPTPQSRDLIKIVDMSRPVIDTVTRQALPDVGATFQVPRNLTKSAVSQVAEGGTVTDSGGTSEWVTVSKVAFKGKDTLSVEAIDWSVPGALEQLIQDFAESYAQQTDKYVADALVSAAVASTAPTADGYQAAITQAIVDSAGEMRRAPDTLLLGLGSWKTLKDLTTDYGEPLFPRLGARNRDGQLGGDPFTAGDVEGLSTAVSLNLTSTDTMLVYPRGAVRFYESPSRVQVRAMQVGTMEWEIGVYGYVAVLAAYGDAVRSVSLTA